MSNREEATFILMGVFLIFLLINRGLRKYVLELVRQLIFSKLVFPVGAFVGMITFSTWVVYKMGFWSYELIAAEVIWFFTVGFSWFLRLGEAGKDSKFFRRRLIEAVGIGAFFEFFLNIVSFSLYVELALQLLLVVIGAAIAVASTDSRFVSVRTTLQWLLGLITIFLIWHTIERLIASWATLDKHGLLNELLMPVWLTICAALCFYPLVLIFGYEVLFLRMFWRNDRQPVSLRARLAVIAGLRGSWVSIDRFNGKVIHDVLEAHTLTESYRIVEAWRKSTNLLDED